MAKNCKYERYRKYVSYNNGITWQPLDEYNVGNLIERNSYDCGYIEPIYKWFKITDSICDFCEGDTSGKYCLYEQYQRYVSYDNGETWTPLNEYMKGDLITDTSLDCGFDLNSDQPCYEWVFDGYVEDECGLTTRNIPIYQWRCTTKTVCDGKDSYYLASYQVSYDNGETWDEIQPVSYKICCLNVSDSLECGGNNSQSKKESIYYYDDGSSKLVNIWENSYESTLSTSIPYKPSDKECEHLVKVDMNNSKADSVSLGGAMLKLKEIILNCQSSNLTFRNSLAIDKVIIGDNVTGLGDFYITDSYYNYYSRNGFFNDIKELYLGKNICSISRFQGCYSLYDINFSDKLTHIGDMFYLWNVTKLNLPSSLTYFGGINYSHNLLRLELPKGCNVIYDRNTYEAEISHNDRLEVIKADRLRKTSGLVDGVIHNNKSLKYIILTSHYVDEVINPTIIGAGNGVACDPQVVIGSEHIIDFLNSTLYNNRISRDYVLFS